MQRVHQLVLVGSCPRSIQGPFGPQEAVNQLQAGQPNPLRIADRGMLGAKTISTYTYTNPHV